jgi:hypothetical protein
MSILLATNLSLPFPPGVVTSPSAIAKCLCWSFTWKLPTLGLGVSIFCLGRGAQKGHAGIIIRCHWD